MPAKNSTKEYLENSYYHIYNRGVEKRSIFLDRQDYSVFLSYLKQYLLPVNKDELRNKLNDHNTSYKERNKILKKLHLNNFFKQIILIAYCLMPNHFHFLVKQTNPFSIDEFMNSIGTRYTMYFNHKYARVGHLYQGVYKAILIRNEEQLLHLTRYIHQQALVLKNIISYGESQPCSYLEYTSERKTTWIHQEEILRYFSKNNPHLSYKNFLNKYKSNEIISKLIVDE